MINSKVISMKLRYANPLAEALPVLEAINIYYSSRLRLVQPDATFPIWLLHFGELDSPLALSEFLCIINRFILRDQFKYASELGEYFEFVNKFMKFRPAESFKPMLMDLLNLKYALEDYRPDLILEIGGGVSSSVFARYSNLSGCEYFMVDPDKQWASNTLEALEHIPNVRAPQYLDLKIHAVDRSIKYVVAATGEKRKAILRNNVEFDYSNQQILKAIEASKRPLVYVDGAPKGSACMGAEFILNERLRENLSGGICLVDCRLNALQLLSGYAKNVYTTACHLLADGKDAPTLNQWQLLEDISFSAYLI